MKNLTIIFALIIFASCKPCERLARKCEFEITRIDTVFLPKIVEKEVLRIDTAFLNDTIYTPTDTLYIPKSIVTYIVERMDSDTSRFDTIGIRCTAFINDGSLYHDFMVDSTVIPVSYISNYIVSDENTVSDWWRTLAIISTSILFVLVLLIFKIKIN